MGSTLGAPSTSPTSGKQIVIVGSSFAGQALVNGILALDHDVQIILVDKNPHFEFICNMWENFCEDAFKKNSVPFT